MQLHPSITHIPGGALSTLAGRTTTMHHTNTDHTTARSHLSPSRPANTVLPPLIVDPMEDPRTKGRVARGPRSIAFDSLRRLIRPRIVYNAPLSAIRVEPDPHSILFRRELSNFHIWTGNNRSSFGPVRPAALIRNKAGPNGFFVGRRRSIGEPDSSREYCAAWQERTANCSRECPPRASRNTHADGSASVGGGAN